MRLQCKCNVMYSYHTRSRAIVAVVKERVEEECASSMNGWRPATNNHKSKGGKW